MTRQNNLQTKALFPFTSPYLELEALPHVQFGRRPTQHDAEILYPRVKVKDRSQKTIDTLQLPELIIFDLDSTLVGIEMFEALLAARVRNRFEEHLDIEKTKKAYHETKNFKGIDSWTQSIQDIILNNSIDKMLDVFAANKITITKSEQETLNKFKQFSPLYYLTKLELCDNKQESIGVTALGKQLDTKFRQLFFHEESLTEIKQMQNQLLINKNLLKLFSKLMTLTGRQVAIVSTRNHDEAVECLMEHNIIDFFDCVVGSVSSLRNKPYQDQYLEVFKALGFTSPPKFIMVGDSESDFHVIKEENSPKLQIVPIATSDPTDFYNTDLQHHQVNGHNAKFSFRWTNRFLKIASAMALCEIKGDTSKEATRAEFKLLKRQFERESEVIL